MSAIESKWELGDASDTEKILALKLQDKDKEIERLNNELELQNIEMGREIERLNNIIKEAREYILNLENSEEINIYQEDKSWVYILEILDKENK